MLEKQFQSKLIKELKEKYPGAVVLKTDPEYIQGFPDLLILWQKHWAALECKRKDKSHIQPNQEFYVDYLNHMSFAAFIKPENKEEVLNAMEQAFKS